MPDEKGGICHFKDSV